MSISNESIAVNSTVYQPAIINADRSWSQTIQPPIKSEHTWIVNHFNNYFIQDEIALIFTKIAFPNYSPPGYGDLKFSPEISLDDTSDHVNLKLNLWCNLENEVLANCEVSLIDKDGQCSHTKISVNPTKFTKKKSLAWDSFVERSYLLDPANELLTNNQLKLRCKVSFSLGLNLGSRSVAEAEHFWMFSMNLKELLVSGKHSDVILSVGGTDLPVHKAILSARSSAFATMFDSAEFQEQEGNRVTIEATDAVTFQKLLQYLYSFQLPEMSIDSVLSLLLLADKYSATNLATKCRRFIADNITEIMFTEAWKEMLQTHPQLCNEICEPAKDLQPITVCVEHTWRIDRFSQYANASGTVFTQSDSAKFSPPHSEHLQFSLYILPNSANFVSAFLRCHHSGIRGPVLVQANLSIINSNGMFKHTEKVEHELSGEEIDEFEWLHFNDLRFSLMDPANELLVNDQLKLHCKVIASYRQLDASVFIKERAFSEFTKNHREGSLVPLLSGKHSDVLFLVDGAEFPANKAILSARSPVFAAMFSHANTKESQENKVPIDDVDAVTFKTLLEYIYSGLVPADYQLTGKLLFVSDKYLVNSLKLVCVDHLFSTLQGECSSEWLANCLLLADLHSVAELKAKCFHLITTQSSKEMRSQIWKAINNARPELCEELYEEVFRLWNQDRENAKSNKRKVTESSDDS